jgi:DNA-binding IclR family transcriptional regulator
MSQSVKRATEILDLLAEGPATLLEVADRFQLHRTTMLRILQTLEQARYVRRRSDGRYTLGPQLFAVACRSAEKLDLRSAGYEPARDLQNHVRHTVHVAALIDDSITYVDKIESRQGIGMMYSRLGMPVLPHCTALGKAVLAFVDQRHRERLLAGVTWERYTRNTIMSREELDEELRLSRERGWAVDNAEFEDFINCVAVPILRGDEVVGALSITALRQIANVRQLAKHVPEMRATAERIAGGL